MVRTHCDVQEATVQSRHRKSNQTFGVGEGIGQRLFQAPTTVLPPLCFSAGMAPRLDDVMCLCSEIASHDQIKVAVKSSAKGAAVAGGTAFVGGLLGGPAGICVGGAVGGLLGSWLTSGQFKPLPQILMELPPNQREQLYRNIKSILGSLDWTDAAQLIALVMGNPQLQREVTAALINYVSKNLGAKVQYGD
ncbi:hypothetical protein CCH79_00014417 [Gambusia affinis]|uniref:CS012 protein n=2 Tax=Gambusia affinis TaxID=33528 RepID=A0A315V1E2_GAMAF|nr:hypothetical protein CCH79_00014417 [Gambusia affinis]